MGRSIDPMGGGMTKPFSRLATMRMSLLSALLPGMIAGPE